MLVSHKGKNPDILYFTVRKRNNLTTSVTVLDELPPRQQLFAIFYMEIFVKFAS